MLDRLDAYFRTQTDALNLRAQRSQLLASNIANADTPHYKAVDLDFAGALRRAQGGLADGRLSLAATAPGHGDAADRSPARVLYRNPTQPSIDGNTVEVDKELSEFSDNAIRYQADLMFLNSRIRNLLTAIQGQ